MTKRLSQQQKMTDLLARWPEWPSGEPGAELLDVTLGLPVDAAFLLLYGGNADMRVSWGKVGGQRQGGLANPTAWGAADTAAAACRRLRPCDPSPRPDRPAAPSSSL